jgi:nitrite reductase (NADH) large subunit
MPKKQLAIIGNGMAAQRLVEELAQRGATSRFNITIFGDEAGACYNRIMLSKILGGSEPETIRMPKVADVAVTDRTRIEKIDPAARTLIAAGGRTFKYDIAVLATGSVPFVPKIEGLLTESGGYKPGAFVYRTLDDCLQIRSKARAGDNAVVLGGGLLGLECAKALRDNGLHVTVVHLAPSLMETQLDESAGKMLQRLVERQGLFIRCGVTIQSVGGDAQVESVKLSDGSVLSADMVVLACGIRPRVELARASNLPVNRGVLVNDHLATSVPGIYAIGECAEHRGKIYGIVPPIWEQCAVLADVLAGSSPQKKYEGSKLYAKLKVAGVDVASMGQVNPTLDTDDVVQVIEDRKSSYRKLVTRDGKLIGAHFVGNTDAAAQVVQMFDKDEQLPANVLEALCSSSAIGGADADPQICNCNKVNRSVILKCIQDGCDNVEAIGLSCKAGTGCGSCRPQLATMLEKAKATAS